MRKASFSVLFIGTASLNREKRKSCYTVKDKGRLCVEGRQHDLVSHSFIMRCQCFLSLRKDRFLVKTYVLTTLLNREQGTVRATTHLYFRLLCQDNFCVANCGPEAEG